MLAPAGGTARGVNGITVTADAITVRLNAYPAGDLTGGDRTRPHQTLFVGTPKD